MTVVCIIESCSPDASAKPIPNQLCDALQPVSADWHTLGMQLGYDADKLNVIKENNHRNVEDCMKDMLIKWQQKYPNKGWSDIISALRNMDRNDVANEIERQYISGILKSFIKCINVS